MITAPLTPELAQDYFDRSRFFDLLLRAFNARKTQSCAPEVLERAGDAAKALDMADFAAAFYRDAAHAEAGAENHTAAARCYRRMLACQPRDARLPHEAGVYFRQQGNTAAALAALEQAHALEPDHPRIACNLANLLREADQIDAAEAHYSRVLKRHPRNAEAHAGLAFLHAEQERHGLADMHYRQALAIAPDWAEPRNNYGLLLRDLARFDEAEQQLVRALALQPDYLSARHNLGSLCFDLGRTEEAEAHYRAVLDQAPDYVEAEFNYSLLLLALGRLREGWPRYERRYDARRQKRHCFPPVYPFPRWRGESLVGRSILIWPEQGLGDQLQFCRFLPRLRQLGAKQVVLVTHSRLVALFRATLPADWVDVIADQAAAIPACHCWTYLMSLPFHFHVDETALLASGVPYLRQPPKLDPALGDRLARIETRKIGLCWKGSPSYAGDARRSPGLSAFSPLRLARGITFFCLMPEGREEFLDWSREATDPDHMDTIASAPGFDLGHELDAATEPFMETLALIGAMDLIISCDTAIAHLAAALGKRVWLALPEPADWRWMRDRTDSPWYPNVRLFRQPQPGDWHAVFREMATRLNTDQDTGDEDADALAG